MNDQKNLLLAMALTLAVLLAFDFFYSKRQPPVPVEGGEAPSLPVDDGERASAPSLGPGDPTRTDGGTAAPAPVADRATALAAGPRIPIRTPRLSGSIALRGGAIDDLVLEDYSVEVGGTEKVVLFNPVGSEDAYYAGFGWAARAGLGIEVPVPDTRWLSDDTELAPGSPVTLTWTNSQGLRFERRIEIDRDYLFTITQSVYNPGAMPVILAPWGLISRRGEPEVAGYYVLHEGPLGVFDRGLEEVTYKDIAEDGTFTAESVGGWLGITDKYWLAAIVPEQDVPFRGRFLRAGNATPRYQVDYLEDETVVPAGGAREVTVRLFAGAKEVRVVERYADAYSIRLFDRAIDWGWFLFLTKPIFFLLDWLNGLTGSFAVAILVLTVLVKAAFFPLANKSYVSMSKMKLVQPKMKKLQERYKDDKARLQQELMELYKKEKINPVSGCLPMLAQIPVFFALYKVLFVTIEMRHAPGLFWIADLSAADPYLLTNLFGLIPWDPPTFLAIGIWPILMSVVMYLQMRLNPTAGDPIQQKVLMAMPFVFLFIMARFPAGLVIYWTWNTLLSGLQQWMIMRRHGVPVAAND